MKEFFNENGIVLLVSRNELHPTAHHNKSPLNKSSGNPLAQCQIGEASLLFSIVAVEKR